MIRFADARRRRLRPAVVALTVLAVMSLSAWSVSAQADEQQEPPEAAADVEDDEADESGIEIDVRVGARRVLVPIAIPDTIEDGGDASEAAGEVEETLRDNMELAGYFDVLPTDSFFFDTDEEGMSAADIGFQNWFNVGAQGLIKSAVRDDDGEIRLDLRLFVVDEGRQAELNWSTTTVGSQDDIRGEVNEFINAVIEHFTGDPGPFGTQIAFAQREGTNTKHIYTISMDGSQRQRISRSDNIHLLPTFGPERTVFFTNYLDGNPDLFAYRNGELDRLSESPGQNSGAAYCDGKLAVTMSHGSDQTNIYLVDPETGAVDEQLTDNWAIDVSPTWSPDCSQIGFVSGRSGGAHIFVMNADGSDQRRLTHQGHYNTEPHWHPRGDRIVFSARDERSSFDIFTVDLEGNIRRLTQDQGNNFEPSYSPDGRHIVFASDREDGRHLWIMTEDGQVQNRLTHEGSDYSEPVWTQ